MPDAPKFKTPFADLAQIAPAPVKTAAELAAEQDAEYGMFVAADQIFIGNALAFMPGHAVPTSAVSDEGPVYPSQVALAQTKKGEPTAAARALTGPPAPEPARS